MDPPNNRFGTILRDGFWVVLLFGAVALVFVFDATLLVHSELASGTSILDAGGSPKLPVVDQGNREFAEELIQPTSEPPPNQALDQEPAETAERASVPELPFTEFVAERPEPKPEQEVEFFSVKSRAESVAFVVDCSGSMAGHRFQRACGELALAVSKLRPDQQVYVVFFNEGPVPLFKHDRAPELGVAAPLAKCDIISQLTSMKANGGTYPEPALAMAASLNPDVIFLLSDGQFDPLSSRTLAFLTHQKIKVNTIAFESPEGAHVLSQIAQDTGGTYRFEPAGGASDSIYHEIVAGLADELVESLVGADDDTRQEIRKRLAKLTRSTDHGPARGASEADVIRAVARWRKWTWRQLLSRFENADTAVVIAALGGDKPGPKWAATVTARKKHLPVAAELIEILAHCDDEDTQSEAHAALVQLAGRDFGRVESGTESDKASLIDRWRKWLGFQGLVRDLAAASEHDLTAELRNDDSARRRAAVVVIRKRKLKVINELLLALRDSDLDVGYEAGQALADLARVSDLGPSLDGSPDRFIPDALIELLAESDPALTGQAAQCLSAIASKAKPGVSADGGASARGVSPGAWKKWWLQEKDERAVKAFVLAQNLYDEGRTDAAIARFKVLIEKFPGTSSAEKAKRLMGAK